MKAEAEFAVTMELPIVISIARNVEESMIIVWSDSTTKV